MDSKDSRAGSLALGLLCAGTGLLIAGLGIAAAIKADHTLTSEDFIAIPAGMIFVFGGALVALPPDHKLGHNLCAALLLTCFAGTLDWIAFGPGERHFGGGIGFGLIGIGFASDEMVGRVAFGVFAVFLDVFAIVMWIHLFRPIPGLVLLPEVPPSPLQRHTTPAGVLGLFTLFAGLCTVFILVGTASDLWDERAQARWPLVTATVERGEVIGISRKKGGTVYQLEVRVSYKTDNWDSKATLHTRTTASESEISAMRAWAARHRRAGKVVIRYDPTAPSHAVFASADVPTAGPRSATDFHLLMICAFAFAALLAIGKIARSREVGWHAAAPQ